MKWKAAVIPILALALITTGCGDKKTDDPWIDPPGSSYDYTDPDAPKTIESKEIISFEYEFPAADLNEQKDRDIPYEICTFTLTRETDNAICAGHSSGYADEVFDFEFSVPLSTLDDLQVIVDRHDLAQVNGIDKGIQGIPPFYATHLSVKYASGESIYASDNSAHVLPLDATAELYDFFLALAKAKDSSLMYSDEE